MSAQIPEVLWTDGILNGTASVTCVLRGGLLSLWEIRTLVVNQVISMMLFRAVFYVFIGKKKLLFFKVLYLASAIKSCIEKGMGIILFSYFYLWNLKFQCNNIEIENKPLIPTL